MTNWLMGTAAILAFVCGTAVLTPAFAQDEGTIEEGTIEPGEEVVDPMPEDGTGEEVVGEVVEEEVVNDGEVVPYGPEDCIECSGGPTTADGGGRPEGENYRGDVVNEAFARTGSDSSDEICDHTKMGKAATICD
jgi:hypothetical protein